jgi:hypothetical protein
VRDVVRLAQADDVEAEIDEPFSRTPDQQTEHRDAVIGRDYSAWYIARPPTSWADSSASAKPGVPLTLHRRFYAFACSAGWSRFSGTIITCPGLGSTLNPQRGRRIVKSAPPSAAFATMRAPPCSVITRCASARPTPWPCDLVVKKGMKILCRSDSGMP